jgi:hypothetical protein
MPDSSEKQEEPFNEAESMEISIADVTNISSTEFQMEGEY